MANERATSRRGLIFAALGLAGVAFGWQRFGVGREKLAFAPLPGASGWQWAQAGGLTSSGGSAADAVFMGIGEDAPNPLPEDQLCQALYGATPAAPAVAVFTDFFCPNCRVLDARLAARSDVTLIWHELPLLGPSSEMVAKAQMAADLQGGYLALKTQLMRAPFRPSLRTFEQAAQAANLDVDRLIADMEGAEVRARLDVSRAAAERLGIWGTPAVAVGKTLVMGAMSEASLDEVIATAGACVA